MFGSQWVNGQRVAINASTAYAAELRKWESQFTQWGPPGRPYVHQDYPAMMYKARRPGNGEHGEYCRAKLDGVHEVGNLILEHVIAETENNAATHEQMGFVIGGPMAAVEALVKLEAFVATAAAERAYTDRKMSPRAQAEADVKESQTIQHLGEIPETPIKRMVKREDK